MPTIQLPHHFSPRPYQLPVLKALDSGVTRAVACWHRRSGKEKTFINYMVRRSYERVGTYFYLFPTYKQAKKSIWEGRDREGFPFLGHFPDEIIESKNETDLKLKLINGSIFQLIGSDMIDSIMSTNPVGCVFAEYSLQDPRAWDYIRPILKENGGWAIFDFTPRGKNHAHTLFELAKQLQSEGDPRWFCQKLTVADTGVLSESDIDAERREGMDEDLIQQEYYCSFSGSQQGSYYGRQMDKAEKEGRICNVPYHSDIGVDTWWDLGIRDAMAVWFTQNVGREVHVIDYLEESGQGFPYYAKRLQEKPYVYRTHNAPHDIKVRELGSGKSRIETAESLGIKFEIVADIGIQDGIDAARAFIDLCWFDRTKTERGRDALTSYHKSWDEKRKCFSSAPNHDWSSNGSDSYRYLAVGHKITKVARAQRAEPERRALSTESNTSWMAT